MRWKRGQRSANVEDRRGRRRRGGRPGGFGRLRLPAGLPRVGGRRAGPKLGLGTVVVVAGVMWLLGMNPISFVLGNVGGLGAGGSVSLDPGAFAGAGPDVAADAPLRTTPEEEALVDFVSFVLDDVQRVWQGQMRGYQDATLVLFRDTTRSACGTGQAEMGPFYCPGDHKVYIDLSFYEELRSRFGAPGDFAQAYVLAHEIGHHVQRLSGVEQRVRRRQQGDPRSANALSVSMELQADCLAGVWGHSAAQRGILEAGDIEEGLRAAAAIGDDRIQQMSGRGVHPESFTHGSSAQRRDWLRRGLESGDPAVCELSGA